MQSKSSDLLRCCVRPSAVMCVKSLWQIWQKKSPPSSKSTIWACAASLSSSCCSCRARASSLSWGSGGRAELKVSGVSANSPETEIYGLKWGIARITQQHFRKQDFKIRKRYGPHFLFFNDRPQSLGNRLLVVCQQSTVYEGKFYMAYTEI